MLTSKRVEGQVEYNDGEFAEIQTIGIEGIDEDLLLETIQIHREGTHDTRAEFQRRFPVGMRLGIVTTTEITKKRVRRTSQASSAIPVTQKRSKQVNYRRNATHAAQAFKATPGAV